MRPVSAVVRVLVLVVLVGGGLAYPNQRSAAFGISELDNGRSLEEDYDPASPPEETNFNPFAFAPLASFVQSMQAMMKKVQLQMGEVLRRMPPQEIDWGKLGNTTSHTKVVNGHRITVNETSYTNKELNSAGAVLHIRVVDVKPEDKEASQYPSPKPTPQVDDWNDKFLYTRIPEPGVGRVERRQSNEIDGWDSLNEVDNSIEVFQPMQPYDLSGDTRVNNLIRDQAKKGGLVMIDPDAELIDVVDGEVRKTYYPHQSIYDQQRTQPIFP